MHTINPRYLLLAAMTVTAVAQGGEFRSVTIRLGAQADSIEQNVAKLLADRIAEPGGLPTGIQYELQPVPDQSLLILLGIPDHHEELSQELAAHRITPLSESDPGPEGFLVTLLPGQRHVLVAAGQDSRGVLYAAGEVLRRLVIREHSVELPETLNVRSAPAFEVRGTQFGQSHIAKRRAGVRDWTAEETQRVIMDYALAGANVFPTGPGPMFDFIKSFGLMTEGGFGANTGSGPPEWNAKESIGRIGYRCLSVPEARCAAEAL